MKRNYNRNTYKIETQNFIYLVTLERLKNSVEGCPRYNANAIVLVAKEDGNRIDTQQAFYTYNYTFKGHYCGDYQECEWLCQSIEESQ